MKIPFTKMHGLGNDFVFVDVREKALKDPEGFAKKFGNRRFGIGADQILLVGKPTHKGADLRMDIYNQDGSRVEMCGNGIRCFAKFVAARKILKKDVLEVETLAGIIRPRILKDGRVEVDMGEPILDAEKIPVKLHGRVVGQAVTVGGEARKMTCVSMGNPHAIFFVDDVAAIDLHKIGPKIENDPLFPKRTNVEFVQVVPEIRNEGAKKKADPTMTAELKRVLVTRVWERGAGITLACGTGACAVAVAGVLENRTGRRTTVRLPGGDLEIDWREKDNRVYMTGPAEEVFSGEVEWG